MHICCIQTDLKSQTLATFLDAALSKKFTNPSSDALAVLAGLHNADTVMSEFVAAVDTVIRSGRTCTYAIRNPISNLSTHLHTSAYQRYGQGLTGSSESAA